MEASSVHADVIALTKVLQVFLMIALPNLKLVLHSLKKIMIDQPFLYTELVQIIDYTIKISS